MFEFVRRGGLLSCSQTRTSNLSSDYYSECYLNEFNVFDFPSKDGVCRYSRLYVGATCRGYKEFGYLSENQLAKKVASVGPLSVAIHVAQSLQSYKSGQY